MSFALERYLKDFGAPQPAQPSFTDFSAENFSPETFPDHHPAEPPQAVDVDAIRNQAYAEGHEAASAELGLRHEEAFAALSLQHAHDIELLRKSYEETAATGIAEGLKQIAGALAEHISAEVAACLAPVMQQEIAKKAVADMAILVQEAILEGEAGPIIVKGPLPLFNILATEMGEDANLLRHVEAEDLDLAVEISGSVLVTRLSAFAASLKKVLE